jgi:ADP-ribosylglycohydrolase/fructose-1,6-bisphosphatase/inositol monophosphatase family enzyme
MHHSRLEPKRPVDPRDLIADVIHSVRDAGALLRAEFHRPGGPRARGYSATIDTEVESLLKSRLLSLHDAGWLGEETGRRLSTSSDTWVVDPNDGTSAFLKGIRGASISVALLQSGRPVLGVVYAPTAPDDSGDLIAWAEGMPVTRNGAPVRRSLDLPGHPIIAMNEKSADYAAANGEVIAPARFVALPSIAYRLALAAVGEVDAAVSLGGLAPWDVAGAHALLTGAGLRLTDLRGSPIDYEEGRGIEGCLGGHPAVVESLLCQKIHRATGKGGSPRGAARPARRVLNPQTLARAQGVMFGQFAGDAIGSAVEFLSPAQIKARYPAGPTDPIDGGQWKTIAGQPTDDSEMALALARCLVAEGRFAEEKVAEAYLGWFRSGPFDCGTTTSSGLRAIAAGRRAASDSQANGALMRVCPIGVLHAGNPAKAALDAAQDARLTHPSPLCVAASSAYAAAIAVGVAGGDREAMWAAAYAGCERNPAGAEVKAKLLASRRQPPESYSGWVMNAFQNAFHFLMSGVPLAEAVRQTVERGEDADTNAAICGALIGAVEGRDGIPVYWRNLIASCRPIAALGHIRPRPKDYWSDDVMDLAEALLAAGNGEGK